MMTRTFVLMMGVAALVVAPALAQQPPPAPTPTPAPPRTATPAPPRSATPAAAPAAPLPPPRRTGQPINVRIDLSINDQRAGSAPIKRTLSMVVADGMGGSIRSQSEVMAVGPVPLNVDANPELLADNKIRLTLTLQYDWPAPIEAGRDTNTAPRGTVIKTALRDSVALILENGKAMIAAQSADPIGDRQVTVEVKATILR
jgi:hypothetical protein